MPDTTPPVTSGATATGSTTGSPATPGSPPPSPPAPTPSGSAPARPPASSSVERAKGSPGGAALVTEHGTTSISSSVVAKIAGMAAQEIPGVQAMGKSMTRALGALRSKVPGGATAATTQGVAVEVGERQAAVDIDIVAYYGVSIVETADAIRHNVIERIETMTGLQVVEVNVSVEDLYIDSGGEDSSEGSRVS